MIDKINGNNGYDFPDGGQHKKKNPAVRAYENTPGFEESSKKKTLAARKKSAASANEKDAGVILDLSAKEADKKKAEAPADRKNDMPWTSMLRRLVNPLLRWLKNFWESEGSKEENTQATVSEITAADADQNLPPLPAVSEMDELSEMQQPAAATAVSQDEQETIKEAALKSRNLDRIEQLVTQNGTKRLAHNSDLLTYYDRRGKFVELDETEKYRVLFGDKNILKL
uniref:Uncharacterized protein n=1 Tax=Eubacterium plexicaudatum ASF492 TaxID=1235802 RepID=N2A6J4_9FIRM